MRELKAVTGVWTADGSRIQLVFTTHPNGGLLVAWPDVGWLGRAVLEPSGGVWLTQLCDRTLEKNDWRLVHGIVESNRHTLPWGTS